MRNLVLLSLLPLSFASTARADSWEARDRASRDVGDYAGYIKWMREYGASTPSQYASADPQTCDAAVEKGAGAIGKKETLWHMDFDVVPGASKVEDHAQNWEIPFSKATWVCKTYRDLRALVAAASPLETYWTQMETQGLRDSSFEARDWYAIATGAEKLDGGDAAALSAECTAAIDRAIDGGAPADVAIRWGRKEELTLRELRARCEASDGKAQNEKLLAWAKAKYEEVAAPLRAAGIKGKRLELFIYYPGEWLLPGCATSTADPKKLKKAKKLFQWLTAPDGTITIRTYKFKGDKYKVSEKQYALESRAYKGCR